MSMHVACRVAQVAVMHMAFSTPFPQGLGAFLGVKLKSQAYVAIFQPLKKIWFYWDKVSFCGSDWPKTQSKAQAGLKGDA